MRRMIVAIAVVVLVTALVGYGSISAADPPDRIWVVAPGRIRVIPEVITWRFEVCAIARERPSRAIVISELRCGSYDLLGALPTSDLAVQVPSAVVRGADPTSIDRWIALRHKLSSEGLADSEAAEYATLGNRIGNPAIGTVPLTLSIDTTKLPFVVENQRDYPITLSIGAGDQTSTTIVTVAVRTLPTDTDWSPGDFHFHSSDFSDGHKTLTELATLLRDSGYKIGYITDHSDGVAAKGWSAYTAAANSASIAGVLKLYPGVEITVGTGYPFVANGDVLAYGVSSLVGLENQIYAPQTEIDNVLNNNTAGPSSPGIAHPTGSPNWGDWTVLRYRGFELMSGALQASFADTASPMVRWRSELTRLLANTFTYGYFASARTGSDYHAEFLEPHRGYVTWIRTANWGIKGSVDSALSDGQTVASQKDSLAYMRMDYGATIAQVGGKLTGVPLNSTLQVRVAIKPIETGTYTIRIYRDNNAQLIYTSTQSYTAGNTYNPFAPSTYLNYTFPGGSHYYFLYISGPDYIYTSPIFVKS